MRTAKILVSLFGVITSGIVVALALYNHESSGYILGWLSSFGWATSSLIHSL